MSKENWTLETVQALIDKRVADATQELERQLAAAQAATLAMYGDDVPESYDTDALDKAIAAATKSLVDALRQIRELCPEDVWQLSDIRKIAESALQEAKQ